MPKVPEKDTTNGNREVGRSMRSTTRRLTLIKPTVHSRETTNGNLIYNEEAAQESHTVCDKVVYKTVDSRETTNGNRRLDGKTEGSECGTPLCPSINPTVHGRETNLLRTYNNIKDIERDLFPEIYKKKQRCKYNVGFCIYPLTSPYLTCSKCKYKIYLPKDCKIRDSRWKCIPAYCWNCNHINNPKCTAKYNGGCKDVK